jgi:hypothetical protein
MQAPLGVLQTARHSPAQKSVLGHGTGIGGQTVDVVVPVEVVVAVVELVVDDVVVAVVELVVVAVVLLVVPVVVDVVVPVELVVVPFVVDDVVGPDDVVADDVVSGLLVAVLLVVALLVFPAGAPPLVVTDGPAPAPAPPSPVGRSEPPCAQLAAKAAPTTRGSTRMPRRMVGGIVSAFGPRGKGPSPNFSRRRPRPPRRTAPWAPHA